MIIFTYWSPWRKMPLKVGVLRTQGSFAGADNGGFGPTAHFIWVLLAFLSFAFTEDFPCLCASSTTNRALQERKYVLQTQSSENLFTVKHQYQMIPFSTLIS